MNQRATQLMKKHTYIWISLFASFFFIQCAQEEHIPDVSDIEVEVTIRRFEQDFFALDTNQLEAELPVLESTYGAFSDIYFGQILGSKDPRIAPEGHIDYVRGFLTYPFVQKLYDTTQVVYPDLDFFQEELTQAFRFLKYYYPEIPTPDVTTFISEFSIANFIYDQQSLATGLDFFLGSDYPYARYNAGNPNFSDYLIRSYNRDHLTSKTIRPLVEDLTGEPGGNRMIDYMVNNGKKLYLLDHLLPYKPDTVIIEYTADQLAWCEENELEIWAHFLREELLYSTDWQNFRKLVEYSPNSPGMPPEAPGRTANWVGWQIVKAYMKRFPDTSMEQLMQLSDSQAILEGSRYRPRR
jgi:hypothetical protein